MKYFFQRYVEAIKSFGLGFLGCEKMENSDAVHVFGNFCSYTLIILKILYSFGSFGLDN